VNLACVEAAGDEAQLAACSECRATASVVTRVARASSPSAPDLWPRLSERLAADHVRLRVPPLGWQAVAAMIAVASVPMLAPEPGRVLAVMMGML
jgi:hypothetical protein